MKGFLGKFLHVPGGREFIIQVPGAANSSLDDKQLAEVMNWILYNFSKKELPVNFIPYSAEEINRLRKNALTDVNYIRKDLIQDLETQLDIKVTGEQALIQ